MANVDGAFGLRPVSKIDGSPYNGAVRRCVIASGDATATFIHDLVTLNGTSVDGYPAVTQSSASHTTEVPFGVVVGFENATPDNLTDQYRKAATQRFCQVLVDPSAVYEIQADDDTSTLAATDVGLNFNIIVGSGDTATGQSAIELDSSTGATTNTLPLTVVGFPDREDNEIASANQKVLVRLNNHFASGATTGV